MEFEEGHMIKDIPEIMLLSFILHNTVGFHQGNFF